MFSSRGKALAIAAAVTLGGFGFYSWQSSRLKKLAVEPQRIAVLPFDNQTSDPRLDPAAAALALLLAEQLSGLPGVSGFTAASPAEAAGRAASLLVHTRIEPSGENVRLIGRLERLREREFEAEGAAIGPQADLPRLTGVIASGIQSAVRPKGALAPPEFSQLAAAIALGRSLEAASAAEALAGAEEALKAEPSCGLCWRRMVEIHAAAGQKQEALARAEASRAVRLTPMSRAVIDYEAARLRGDAPEQRSALERLSSLRAGEPEYLARLGALLAGLGQWKEAAATYRSAVQAAPREPNLWNEFGYALAWSGNYEEALRALNEYARLDPNSANPADSQGEVAVMAGRFAEAINYFEQSYKKDKSFNGGQAIEKAGLAAYLNGEKARAASYFDRYLSALPQPQSAAARLAGAKWQSALGGIGSALKMAETADPLVAVVIAAAAGDKQEALDRLARAPAETAARGKILLASSGPLPSGVADRPELASLRALRAALNADWRDASKEFSLLLKAAPANSAQASLLRECAAWALVMDSRPAEASSLLKTAWPAPPPPGFSEFALLVYPNLFYTRAEIAAAAGRREEARKYYDLFLLYAGERKDGYGMIARARAAARL